MAKISKISSEGLRAFLQSPFIKGIGKIYASKIAEEKGMKIFSPDFNFHKELSEIGGLGQKKIEDIEQSFKNLKYPPDLLPTLYSASLSDAEVEKITSHYKKNTEKVICEDPYQMVEEVFKLSFFVADKIGKFFGIPKDDPRRIKGGLLTAVKITAEKGSMFALKDEAVEIASKILELTPEHVYPQIENLIKEERIISSFDGLYLPVYYKAEKEGAEKIAEIMRHTPEQSSGYSIPQYDNLCNKLSSDQILAIKTVEQNQVTIITGGPGTGKTTTVRGIVKLFEDMDKKVVLAAPTGRAAKRLADLAGKEATTLHRLLGYSQGKGYRNKRLDIDLIIIDEASMLEQVMFNHILQAITPATRIVLVGDEDQLPAIGAGNVLKDAIKSHTLPVIKLNHNFRHGSGSHIAENAAAIKSGEMPESNVNDFIILTENTSGKIHDRLLRLVAQEIPEKYQINPRDIQVVTPQQEGSLGAKQLNIDLRDKINPEGPELRNRTKIFRVGDRVMQTSNSSDRNIYNGETGWVSNIDEEKGWLEVTFYDGKVSRYMKRELKELSLAYATTVHKLQGSETDYMIMPVSLAHKPMLYRNLLYTGVSRAKKLCVLVGEEKAIRSAVENPQPSKRNSNFIKRLRENLPHRFNNDDCLPEISAKEETL